MRFEASQELRPERYRSYLIVLARTLLRAGGPAEHKIDASDLVQEVLLQAHVARSQFQGETEAELVAWLRAILANKLADSVRHFARKKRDAALEQSYRETLDTSATRLERLVPAQQTSPSQKVLRRERALVLAEALADLPDDQRTAVELHHLSGYSVAEIAEQMNRTKASVAGLLRRGLKDLRERLKAKDLE
ncbi:sigma-70 family RNA polymerase sigma factor [Acidobacteria bacterium AH-259-L09]|nr:sigma-70 family RNA polymerase sigma factor [Acidobacteria bacterium AH-259-L09]